MAQVPQPIPENPSPTGLAIVAAQRGAYSERFTDAEGVSRTLVEHLNALAQASGASSGSVVRSFQISNTFGSSTVNTPNAEAWHNDSTPATAVLFVPSLEDLGIDDPNNYRVEARGGVLASDPNSTADLLEVRIVDLEAASPVAGSLGSGPLAGSDLDVVVLTPWVEIRTNTSFLVDFRKLNDNLAAVATVRNQFLYLRITRR